MAASSTPPGAASLPRVGMVRERLAKAKSAYVADRLGKDDSWVRKVRNGECGILVSEVEAFLDALEIKAVCKTKKCYPSDLAKALETIARRALMEKSMLEEDLE